MFQHKTILLRCQYTQSTSQNKRLKKCCTIIRFISCKKWFRMNEIHDWFQNRVNSNFLMKMSLSFCENVFGFKYYLKMSLICQNFINLLKLSKANFLRQFSFWFCWRISYKMISNKIKVVKLFFKVFSFLHSKVGVSSYLSKNDWIKW